MPLISKIGRRSKAVRILNTSIHLLLLAGGITMVYPFLIMLSGSAKSDLDFKYFNMVPKYLSSETILFQKHLYTKYNSRLSIANDCLNEQLTSFEKLEPPPGDFPSERVKDWDTFLDSAPKEMDHYYYGLGAVTEGGVQPEMLRAIKNWLKQVYQNDYEKLNEDLGTKISSWEEIGFTLEDFTVRRATGDYQGIL